MVTDSSNICCTNEWNELPILIIRESPSLVILRQDEKCDIFIVY